MKGMHVTNMMCLALLGTGGGVDKHDDEDGDHKYRAPTWLSAFLIIVITLVWAAMFVTQMLNPQYRPDGRVHIVFFAVLGIVFGREIVKGLNR